MANEVTKANIPELVRNIRQSERAITTYAFPAKPFPHGLQMIFHKYDYSNYAASFQIDGAKINSNPNLGLVPEKNSVEESSTNSLELPFPRTLRDATQTQVTAFERDFLYERLASGIAGVVGGSFGETAQNIGELATSALSAAREAGKGVIKDGFGATLEAGIRKAFGRVSSDTAKQAGAYLARKFLSGDLAKTFGAVAGTAVNPQQTLAFEGVNLREFTFEWDLYPANKEDTEQITKIVRFLKSQMLPATQSVAGIKGLERAFLEYPAVVELSLLGVQEKHFVRFKRAMIDNVTVDYTGGGSLVSIIKGGVPASVTLSVSFKELTIQTANDYAEQDPTGSSSVKAVSTGQDQSAAVSG